MFGSTPTIRPDSKLTAILLAVVKICGMFRQSAQCRHSRLRGNDEGVPLKFYYTHPPVADLRSLDNGAGFVENIILSRIWKTSTGTYELQCD